MHASFGEPSNKNMRVHVQLGQVGKSHNNLVGYNDKMSDLSQYTL